MWIYDNWLKIWKIYGLRIVIMSRSTFSLNGIKFSIVFVSIQFEMVLFKQQSLLGDNLGIQMEWNSDNSN